MTNLDILANSPAVRMTAWATERILAPKRPKHPALVKALLLAETYDPVELVGTDKRARAESILEKAEDLTYPITDDIEKDDALDMVEDALHAREDDALKNSDEATVARLVKLYRERAL